MNDEGIKGRIEKFVNDPGVTFEKAVKDIRKNKKFIEVINSPGIAIEEGVKKGWEYIIFTGKDVKNTVTKKSKRKRKKSIR